MDIYENRTCFGYSIVFKCIVTTFDLQVHGHQVTVHGPYLYIKQSEDFNIYDSLQMLKKSLWDCLT